MARTPGLIARKRNLRVNLSDDELAMLRVISVDAGVTSSDMIRLLVREAYRRNHGDKKPPPAE